MQRIGQILFAILMFAFVLSACNASPTQAPPAATATQITGTGHGITSEERELPITEAEVSRISIDDARAALENGTAIMVDVRSSSAFEASHIAGAISVPLGQIERDLPSVTLGKEQWIITYCT